ncbi:pseudouridine synthase (pseudouridines 1911, 1915, 1917 in 23S RNA) [Candidatus Blochmanniella floridana]|uniref:Ribosomal large subunit pseudouridine synthase D n=1 Tax=Blochmanniella floridana TaxID=203907 RepID=RLUD_BLOFL|nr:RecName: Full=Ribosomal large subunit pseudouridine synthase D; AltName: Full=23S rRNA pseudouridine(1911/1915/1917) synthase; AltName: Full=rRNA pseudouridylate synthase D; AltName: Full=rRNA-uridine isomerase D [Candidatus Blochmannia floridanus]CAD83700.1 pseudouridine synthase (pseudouridines 1911, 1915, 1917 in 23S RNA) [Candidatus Blochmannia floridanus]
MVIIKPMIVQVHQSGYRLDYILSKLLPQYSRSQIKHWILNKKVVVNNQVSTLPRKKVVYGELIEIKYINNNDICKSEDIVPQNIPLNIIYEDNDILVINKASNMVVHPGIGHYQGTVLNALLYRYPSILKISKQAGIVQRLDKDTTGLMIIAKTVSAYDNLLRSFKLRKVVKEYDAIVYGKFTSNAGVVNQPMRRHFAKRTFMSVHYTGKSAVTYYSVVEEFKAHSRVRINLKTGRTHQIRVHMAYINHPLVGDQKYKGNFSVFDIKKMSDELNNYLLDFNRQALHACTLQLLHPITQVQMKWNAPLPQDILQLIAILKKY